MRRRLAASALVLGCAVACGGQQRVTFAHTVDQCDQQYAGEVREACHRCVTQPPPPGATWVYSPHAPKDATCRPGNPEPY